ncbi:hypothetical protein [Ruegeria arenilitoris]|uniref:hypothetical protein n=1 Tax=Ruegeria arenilitoris TaxID=1173585 RepID=UPI0014799E87|nr:hypothetical protein [Ruegeria arenilitoris]
MLGKFLKYIGFLTLIFGVIWFSPRQSSSDVVDFFEHECGKFACASIYQGEGVPHPQIIVSMYRKGSGVDRSYITLVYDYPDGALMSYSLYIDSHLAFRRGGPSSVDYTNDDREFMAENWLTFVDGVEAAFNSPSTAWLKAWPNQNRIFELVEKAAELTPDEFRDWDRNNGTAFEEPVEINPDIGASGELIPGPIVCEICPPEGPFSEAVLPSAEFTATESFARRRADEISNIGIEALPSMSRLTEGRNLAVPVDDDIRRQAGLMQTVLEREPRPGVSPELSILLGGETQSQPLVCHTDELDAEPTLASCRDRCSACREIFEAQILADATGSCASVVVVTATAISLETLGVSIWAAAAGGSTITGICTAAAVSLQATKVATLDAQCNMYCETIWKDADN